MNRLEEINKQIAELEAERKELAFEKVKKAKSELEKYYQDALTLKGKYIKWDVVDIVHIAKVVNIIIGSNEVELELGENFTLFPEGAFSSYYDGIEVYAAYSLCDSKVIFNGDKFKVIRESEYIEFVYDAVDKFCHGVRCSQHR